MTAFGDCMGGNATPVVTADIALAAKLRINGTPTIMIGRRHAAEVDVTSVIVGAKPLEEFVAAIKMLLDEH
jgi:protein-disulfide isomerase